MVFEQGKIYITKSGQIAEIQERAETTLVGYIIGREINSRSWGLSGKDTRDSQFDLVESTSEEVARKNRETVKERPSYLKHTDLPKRFEFIDEEIGKREKKKQ